MLTVLQKCADNLQPLSVLGLSILLGKENVDLAVKRKLQLCFFCCSSSHFNNKPLFDSSAGGILQQILVRSQTATIA